MIPGIGPVRVRRLLESMGSVERILLARESELASVEGISNELARKIIKARDEVDLVREKKLALDHGVEVIDVEDELYPQSLKEIYDPPLVLYIKGKIPKRFSMGIGVIGTREPTSYGRENAKKFSFQLAYAGVSVISGLARGVDTYAHQGALAAKGATWAVVGCGLMTCYPSENQSLMDKIAEENCVISEFPMETKPDRQTFPMRNRIVSGLSHGVLVIEAGAQSGALITARMALDQGRNVYAIPGRIDQAEAKGCHILLKQGAKLVESVEDILQDLNLLIPPKWIQRELPEVEKLTGDEAVIYEALGKEETHVDRVIQKTGLPSSKVSSTLLRLEMKKRVQQLPGQYFIRIL
ncbi:MAG: DNA-processing protein DprA [Verrucomicrobiota bacterium]